MTNLKTIFSIDLRSLALFRISLAVMIVVDLLFRSRDLENFYTDNGVLSRVDSIARAHDIRWSLHWISGAEWVQGILFITAGFITLCLLVGYRTRLMSVLSWCLLVSLQNRNDLILNGGDNLLVILNFWAMLLPIGARWSIDAALNKQFQLNPNAPVHKENAYFSIISIAVLLQVMYLYFFTALLKTGDPWRVTMDAAWYAVQIDQYATVIGQWMRNFPALLTFGTYFVWYLEILAIFLVFSPIFHVPLRLITLGLLFIMHGAFFLSLHIVLFPFIDFTALALLLPGAFWVGINRLFQNKARDGIHIYYDEGCHFCKKICLIFRTLLLPSTTPILPAQSNVRIYSVMEKGNTWVVTTPEGQQYTHWQGVTYLLRVSILFKPLGWLLQSPPFLYLGNRLYHQIANNRHQLSLLTEKILPYKTVTTQSHWFFMLLGAYAFYIVTYINISGVDEWSVSKPQHVATTERLLRLDQRWDMFAPYPLTYSLMPFIPGHTKNGDIVDVYQMSTHPPSRAWPSLLSWEYENYRWRKYLNRLQRYQSNRLWTSYGAYLCRQWNNQAIATSEQLASFEVYFERKKTAPYGTQKEPSRIRPWRHWCFSEYAPEEPLAFLK